MVVIEVFLLGCGELPMPVEPPSPPDPDGATYVGSAN